MGKPITGGRTTISGDLTEKQMLFYYKYGPEEVNSSHDVLAIFTLYSNVSKID